MRIRFDGEPVHKQHVVESMVIVAVVTNEISRVVHKYNAVIHNPFAHIQIFLSIASYIIVFNLVDCRAKWGIGVGMGVRRPLKHVNLT